MKRFINIILIAFTILSGSFIVPISICYASPVDIPAPQNIESAIRQAQARYDSGNVSGAATLLSRILERYPDNKEAKALFEKCKETERADYNNAVSSMSVSSLEAFIKKYPESSFNDRVHQLIEDLPLWLEASKENTIESYNRYLSNSSQKIYQEEAALAITDLTVESAYQIAVEKNTIKAYEEFRSSYPGSKRDKDASNKIARLMADKFTSRSTYTDRANALSYAMNEMTRDYVSNKFNAATAKNITASSGTYSSSSSSTSSNTVSPTTEKGSKYKDPFVMLGIDASADYYNKMYLLSAGPIIRFGRVQSTFFLTASVKYAKGGFHGTYWQDSTEETWWGGYNRDLIEVEGRGDYISIPVTFNWNTCSSLDLNGGFYLGAGVVYNHLLETNTFMSNDHATSFLWQIGCFGRHWDARFGMSFYSTPLSNADYSESSTVFGGISLFF
jgi:hypothetical protein